MRGERRLLRISADLRGFTGKLFLSACSIMALYQCNGVNSKNRGIFMAQRLATEYVQTCLELTEAELSEFVGMFTDHKSLLHVKILENGSQEVVVRDVEGEEIVLSFKRMSGNYVLTGSCRLSSPQLANLMRKAVAHFKGNAIVNRLYTDFTMVYHYEHGTVVKIMEDRNTRKKVIYEYKNTAGQLERLFHNYEVENEIEWVRGEVNRLLDLRNLTALTSDHAEVDAKLKQLTHRLFVLEV
jgi:hypothetical protein